MRISTFQRQDLYSTYASAAYFFIAKQSVHHTNPFPSKYAACNKTFPPAQTAYISKRKKRLYPPCGSCLSLICNDISSFLLHFPRIKIPKVTFRLIHMLRAVSYLRHRLSHSRSAQDTATETATVPSSSTLICLIQQSAFLLLVRNSIESRRLLSVSPFEYVRLDSCKIARNLAQRP